MFSEDNFSYQGEIKNGIPHGQGVLTKSGTKERYIGTFVDGKLHGPVQIYALNGSLLFDGDFKFGK
jgi:hypothetical protein